MDDVTLDQEIDGAEEGLTGSMKANLKDAFSWMRTVAILSLIMSGILVLMMIWMFSVAPSRVAEDLAVALVFWVIFGVLQVFLMITLFKAGAAYKSFLQTNSASDLEMAFAKQKQFWLITGILAIIGTFFFVIGFFGFMTTVNGIGGPF